MKYGRKSEFQGRPSHLTGLIENSPSDRIQLERAL